MSSKPVKRKVVVKPRKPHLNSIKVLAKKKKEGGLLGKLFKRKLPKGLPMDTGHLIFTRPHANSPLHSLHVRSSLPIYDAAGFHNARETALEIIARLERQGYTKYSIADVVAAMIYETNGNADPEE